MLSLAELFRDKGKPFDDKSLAPSGGWVRILQDGTMTELLKVLPHYLARLNHNCTSELNIRVRAYCHAEKQRNSDYATFLRQVEFNHVINVHTLSTPKQTIMRERGGRRKLVFGRTTRRRSRGINVNKLGTIEVNRPV